MDPEGWWLSLCRDKGYVLDKPMNFGLNERNVDRINMINRIKKNCEQI